MFRIIQSLEQQARGLVWHGLRRKLIKFHSLFKILLVQVRRGLRTSPVSLDVLSA